MGLYQYIREQAHRDDLVGELGRWLAANYGLRPNHDSRAFRMAAAEFDACHNWTRHDALERFNNNAAIQQILKAKPRVREAFVEAIQIRAKSGYSKDEQYDRLKSVLSDHVGYFADDTAFQDSESYTLIIGALSDLLPPDVLELYPNGTPEDTDLDL